MGKNDSRHGGVDYGYFDGNKYEKDFDLKLSTCIYKKLKDMGFCVYMTRNEDYTLDNCARYEYINSIVDGSLDKTLVFSIHINNDDEEQIDIIHSVNSSMVKEIELFNRLNAITEVKTKTLPNDHEKDFYAIQRLIPENVEAIVLEFGYKNLNDTEEEIKTLASDVVNVMLDIFDCNVISSCDEYIVKADDSIYDIAKTHNLDVDILKRNNHLNTDTLDIGQVLKIPKMKKHFYIVKRGDSLYSISKKFNTTVEKIKDINNLVSNKLAVNQKLSIPD